MRFRSPASDQRTSAQRGADFDHFMFNRSVLLWAHLALAFAAALMYMTTLDNSWLKWWRRGAGDIELIRSIPAMIPYIVSGVLSRRLITGRRFGIWIFVAVLVAGTAAVGYLYMTGTVDKLPVLGTLATVTVQTVVFGLAAVILLARECGD